MLRDDPRRLEAALGIGRMGRLELVRPAQSGQRSFGQGSAPSRSTTGAHGSAVPRERDLGADAVEPERCAAIGFHRRLLLSLDGNSGRVRVWRGCVKRGPPPEYAGLNGRFSRSTVVSYGCMLSLEDGAESRDDREAAQATAQDRADGCRRRGGGRGLG